MSNTSGSLLVKAQCNSDNGVDREKMIECLVDNGYAQETAEALDERKLEEIYGYILDGMMMDVSTCAMEVDTLFEIENYLSCTEEELQDFGLTEEEIDECDEELSEILSMSNKELKQNFSLSNTEVKVSPRFHISVIQFRLVNCLRIEAVHRILQLPLPALHYLHLPV